MKELGKIVEEQNIQIPWSSISKRMGRRSRLSCFKKWQKMSGTFQMEDFSMDPKRKIEDDEEVAVPDKRIKTESTRMPYADAPTAGAAAAMAAGHHPADYDVYSAKIAAETVEAVDLPDADTLGPTSVREI